MAIRRLQPSQVRYGPQGFARGLQDFECAQLPSVYADLLIAYSMEVLHDVLENLVLAKYF